MTPDSVTIVGANAAGLSAAATLRASGYEGVVRIVDLDAHACCERPRLSKGALVEALAYDDAPVLPLEFLDSCELLLGERVLEIRPAENALITDRRRIERAGTIVLAPGSEPLRPRFANDGSLPALTLRSWHDALALRSLIASATQLLIVGGGVIGCEVAATAAAGGVRVTLIEREDRLMKRAFDPSVGDAAMENLRRSGVRVVTETSLVEVTGGTVRLSGGESLALDGIVFGVGARPRTGLAEAAGLACRDGIEVDAAGATALPGVYAAGDVARGPFGWQGARLRHESQTAALEQGAACAAAILGREPRRWLPYVWSDQGAHTYTQIGWRPPGALAVRRRLRGESDAPHAALVFQVHRRRIAGVSAVDAGRELGAARRLIGRPAPPLDDLANPAVGLRTLAASARAEKRAV